MPVQLFAISRNEISLIQPSGRVQVGLWLSCGFIYKPLGVVDARLRVFEEAKDGPGDFAQNSHPAAHRLWVVFQKLVKVAKDKGRLGDPRSHASILLRRTVSDLVGKSTRCVLMPRWNDFLLDGVPLAEEVVREVDELFRVQIS